MLELKKICTKEELIQHLGHVAEADPEKHKRSLRTLIDYLLYVSLIKLNEESGEIKLSDHNGQIEQSIPVQPTTNAQPKTKEAAEEKSIKKEIVQEKIIEPEISFKNQVNVNISIELKISPETSKADIKEKIEALVEALRALK